MALYVLFCKDLMVNVESSPVRTFTVFPKHVTFIPRYEHLVLGNTLNTVGGVAGIQQYYSLIHCLTDTSSELEHTNCFGFYFFFELHYADGNKLETYLTD